MSQDKKEFSVIGYYESNGQTFLFHTHASDPMQAISAVAADTTDPANMILIAAIPGHLLDDKHIFFAGFGCVDGETVLAQPDVFPTGTSA